MVGNKPGNHYSKHALFEEIDFAIFADQDRTVSFLTNRESIQLWISCLKEYYESIKSDSTTNDLIWTEVKSQRKISAQIRQQSYNKDGATTKQLTISFYCSTFRILLQGNECKLWSSEVFPKLKLMVHLKRNDTNNIVSKENVEHETQTKNRAEITELETAPLSPETPTSSQTEISQGSGITQPPDAPGKKITTNDDIRNKEDIEYERQKESREEILTEPESALLSPSTPTSPHSKKSATIIQSPTVSNKNLIKSVVIESPRTPKRLLPSPPTKAGNTNQALVKAVAKLESENLQLKEKIHDLSVENSRIDNELNQQKQLIIALQDNIRKINTEKSSCEELHPSSFELELMKTEIEKQFTGMQNKLSKSLTSNTENIFTRLRALEEETRDSHENREDQNKWRADFYNKADKIEKTMNELMKEVNQIQEKLFTKTDRIEAVISNDKTLAGNPSSVSSVTSSQMSNERNNTPLIERQNKSTQEPIFRDMYGRGLIFGDSNTKGLDPKLMRMRIGSLGGATIDSSINHIHTNNKPDYSTQQVIYHLGTNNIVNDDVEDVKQKFDKLIDLAGRKYPKANIGICKIPETSREELNRKIYEVNAYISKSKGKHFIDNDVSLDNLVRDKVHYNKRGLSLLAKSIKAWSRSQGYIFHNPRAFNHQSASNYASRDIPYYQYHEPREYFDSNRQVFDYGHGIYDSYQRNNSRQHKYNNRQY